jgi:hypothetical protein
MSNFLYEKSRGNKKVPARSQNTKRRNGSVESHLNTSTLRSWAGEHKDQASEEEWIEKGETDICKGWCRNKLPVICQVGNIGSTQAVCYQTRADLKPGELVAGI